MMVIVYSAVALLFTLAGAMLVVRYGGINRRFLAWALAFSSGVLVSVAFMDILPAGTALDPDKAYWGCLAALLALFLIESHTLVHSCHDAFGECSAHTLGTVAFIALSLHDITDGVNIAIGVKSGGTVGFGIAMGVIMHKFTSGVALAALLLQSGRDSRRTVWLSLFFALMTPLGAFATAPFLSDASPAAMALLLGLSGGSFIYIAMADILPELHRSHDKYARLIFPLGYLTVYIMRKLGAD